LTQNKWRAKWQSIASYIIEIDIGAGLSGLKTDQLDD
jgi:hypothetical protein